MDDGTKNALHRYLQRGREDLLWKLDGATEYDVRRPLTPTGTNLLGLVKHVASVEAGYFGEVFGRPFPEPFPWFAEDADPNDDMWATAEESRADVTGLYRRVWAHSDATITALALDARGRVPWWPEERRDVSLVEILARVLAETHRHAGHADIVRELVDGTVGLQQGNENLAEGDATWWQAYRDRIEANARRFGEHSG